MAEVVNAADAADGEWIDISGDGGIQKEVLEAAPADVTTPETGLEVSAH